MGSSCEAKVGGLVWVQRRNGCWWPGRILGLDELPVGRLGVPQVGTPVKLLGREDGSVDWYNFERSKRVKPFRCGGEYDDWIENAKNNPSLSIKVGQKYIRREHAILHALEIERSQLSEQEQPDEETENMSDKLSGLESLSVSPPEHHPDISVHDSEDDRSQKRTRGLKDIGIGGELKPSVKRKRSQVAYGHDCVKKKNRRCQLTNVLKRTEKTVMEPPDTTCEKFRNLNDVKQSLSNSSGDSSGRLFDVPYIGCEPNQTPAGLVTENENAQAVGGPQSGQSSLVETVLSAGPDEIQESGSISSGAAGDANDINHIIIENGPAEWQHKGKRNVRVKTKNVQKILYPEVKIEPDVIMTDTETTAPQRSMPYRHSRFTVNPKYQSCVSYNDNDTISLYDVDIELQAAELPQDIPYISLMSKLTRQRITGHSLLVEVLNDSVSDLSVLGSERVSSSYELDGVDVATVSEDSKKSKIRKLSSITCLEEPSETLTVVKLGRGKYIRDKTKKRKRKASTALEKPSEMGHVEKLGSGKYIRDKSRKFKTLDMVRSCDSGELKESETGTFKRPDEVPACVPLKVIFSRIREALRIVS